MHGGIDPVSGQPDSKATPVTLSPLACSYYGLLLSLKPLSVKGAGYWSWVRNAHGYTTFVAFSEQFADGWGVWLKDVLGAFDGDCIELTDDEQQVYRAAFVSGERLVACGFIHANPKLPARDWLEGMFNADAIDTTARKAQLTGRSLDGYVDPGNLVCACFGVGENTIAKAIRARSLTSTEGIGESLKAGTNCGSCVPELRCLLNAEALSD